MGDRLRQMREALHLSQADVAKVLGVSPGTISKIEIGLTSPRPATITLLCKAYGVSEEWFRNGNGPMLDPTPTESSQEKIPLDMQTVCDAIMKTFRTLTEEQQDIVLEYIQNLVDTLSKSEEDPN